MKRRKVDNPSVAQAAKVKCVDCCYLEILHGSNHRTNHQIDWTESFQRKMDLDYHQ